METLFCTIALLASASALYGFKKIATKNMVAFNELTVKARQLKYKQ